LARYRGPENPWGFVPVVHEIRRQKFQRSCISFFSFSRIRDLQVYPILTRTLLFAELKK
jgi:hypothetical protein